MGWDLGNPFNSFLIPSLFKTNNTTRHYTICTRVYCPFIRDGLSLSHRRSETQFKNGSSNISTNQYETSKKLCTYLYLGWKPGRENKLVYKRAYWNPIN